VTDGAHGDYDRRAGGGGDDDGISMHLTAGAEVLGSYGDATNFHFLGGDAPTSA
jgi:hypothetical protein